MSQYDIVTFKLIFLMSQYQKTSSLQHVHNIGSYKAQRLWNPSYLGISYNIILMVCILIVKQCRRNWLLLILSCFALSTRFID